LVVNSASPSDITGPATGFVSNNNSAGDQVIPLAALVQIGLPNIDQHSFRQSDQLTSLIFALIRL